MQRFLAHWTLVRAVGRVRHAALIALGSAVLCSGCAASSGGGAKPTGVTAERLCDGALDAEAAAALERLFHMRHFTELTGVNGAGESNSFSVSRAVRHLHDDATSRSKCSIYSTKSGDDFPLLQIEFYAAEQHPNPTSKASNRLVTFPVGVYAATGTNGADLFFGCTTKTGTGATHFIKGEMFSPSSALESYRSARDHMVVLNSVARRIADEAGCSSEANLPRKVPST